jgi:hypothetical protein
MCSFDTSGGQSDDALCWGHMLGLLELLKGSTCAARPAVTQLYGDLVTRCKNILMAQNDNNCGQEMPKRQPGLASYDLNDDSWHHTAPDV